MRSLSLLLLIIFSGFCFSNDVIREGSTKEKNLSEFERMLVGIESCDVKDVYFDEDKNSPVAKYFFNKNISPLHIDTDYVSYAVKELFYGVPVEKIVIPNRYPVHALYFGVSKSEAERILSEKLNIKFYSVDDEHYFDRPILMIDTENESKSILTCGPKN